MSLSQSRQWNFQIMPPTNSLGSNLCSLSSLISAVWFSGKITLASYCVHLFCLKIITSLVESRHKHSDFSVFVIWPWLAFSYPRPFCAPWWHLGSEQATVSPGPEPLSPAREPIGAHSPTPSGDLQGGLSCCNLLSLCSIFNKAVVWLQLSGIIWEWQRWTRTAKWSSLVSWWFS